MTTHLVLRGLVFAIAVLFIGSTANQAQIMVTKNKIVATAGTQLSTNFTIVALPDTQYYSKTYPNIYTNQTQWIVSHKDELNIVYVAHEGDIVNNEDQIYQWDNANSSMSLLEDPATTNLTDGIPYSVLPGNHDQPTTNYNQYFGFSRFTGRSYYGGHYSSNNDNNYVLFSADGMDFIAISLQYNPDANKINWADSLLQNYSGRRAIVISHYILNTNGSFGGCGQTIYDTLKHNSNLFLMLCGHVYNETRRSDSYNGSTVYSLLADYQNRSHGGNGWLRVMEFCPATNEIEVKTYSPYLNQFETDNDSQFYLVYNMGGGNLPPNKPNQPSGQTSGAVGVEYNYTTSTTDPEGDQVYYMWDFGDGTNTSWIGPYNSGVESSASHIWGQQGAYVIKVKAKDTKDAESDWATLNVVMPRDRALILRFLDLFPHAFPMLRYLLGL